MAKIECSKELKKLIILYNKTHLKGILNDRIETYFVLSDIEIFLNN